MENIEKMEKEQIIKVLEICTSSDQGASCPIKCPYGDINNCEQSLFAHSLALIREQEKQISDLEANNKNLAAERDRYFDMVCRAVNDYVFYDYRCHVDVKEYFGLTDEEYDTIIKYIKDNFYKEPDITEDPSVYDVEIIRSDWGFDGLGWSCFRCGEYPVPGQADPHKPMLDTCPNCGAVMDNADKTAEEVLFPSRSGNERDK